MKKIIYSLLIAVVAVLIYAVLKFYASPDYDKLNFIHRIIAFRIVGKWEKYNFTREPEKRATLDYDSLIAQLSFYEKEFVSKIFSINPKELGFLGPFYSKEKPSKLVMIENVILDSAKEIQTGIQYCPQHSYNDYVRMMTAMKMEIGKQLYIDSGYRSPGRQAYLFFYYLVRDNDYSLLENAKWIAMPGYSEHGNPINNACDFINEDGVNGFSRGQTAEDFEKLDEYKWLLANGQEFNFYLSYPRDNPYGVEFEPWHWHWNVSDKNIFKTKEETIN